MELLVHGVGAKSVPLSLHNCFLEIEIFQQVHFENVVFVYLSFWNNRYAEETMNSRKSLCIFPLLVCSSFQIHFGVKINEQFEMTQKHISNYWVTNTKRMWKKGGRKVTVKEDDMKDISRLLSTQLNKIPVCKIAWTHLQVEKLYIIYICFIIYLFLNHLHKAF